MSFNDIGEMRHRITIQIPTKVSDGMGSFTTTWNDHATIWAKAWTVSSSEITSDMKVGMVRVQKFKIWYRNPLRSSWRIKWGIRYFDITGIDSDDNNEFIFLTVKEAV